MLNPILWKKVQGQKHPGRWGIVEHQIPSIKVLFKTNAKSHKHPGIKLLSSESKTQLVKQRNRTHIEEHTYIYIFNILTQSFWRGTKVIRGKHIQDNFIYKEKIASDHPLEGELLRTRMRFDLFSVLAFSVALKTVLFPFYQNSDSSVLYVKQVLGSMGILSSDIGHYY